MSDANTLAKLPINYLKRHSKLNYVYNKSLIAYFHVHSFRVTRVSRKKYCSVIKGLFHNTKERRSSLSCCFLSLRDESVGTVHKLLTYDIIIICFKTTCKKYTNKFTYTTDYFNNIKQKTICENKYYIL